MSSRSSAGIGALLLSLVAAPAAQQIPATPSAQSPAPVSPSVVGLQHDIDAILDAPELGPVVWGVLVKPVDRNETWYAQNAGKLMAPASTLKIVTLAAAADKLGWDYKYETRVFPVGSISDGVLHGDLVVVGSGDPSIDDWDGQATRLFAEWAEQLKAAGISTIQGRIIGDDHAFDNNGLGTGWAWDDLPAGFSAPVSALQYNVANVQITVGPGARVGARAAIIVNPESGVLTVNNRITTGAARSAATVVRRRLPGTTRLELRGSVPLRSRPFAITVSVDNPTMYFVTALRRALIADGIAVRGAAVDIDDLVNAPARNGAAPLVTYQSPPLTMLATTMMKLSQNQYAEALFKTLGGVVGGKPGTAEGGRAATRALLQDWNIAPDTVVQVDGSGLSRHNFVTPEAIVAILSHVHHDPRLREAYEATLPIAGRDGTLETRMRGTAAEGNARVKTGSLTHARTMAGYVRTADGETLTFAIFANNFVSSASAINAASDAIVVRLATFRR